LQLPAVGGFWHYFSNISLIPIAIGILPAQIFNKPLTRQLLVGDVIGCVLIFLYQYVSWNTKNFIQFANHF
jgi:hypothetical protein